MGNLIPANENEILNNIHIFEIKKEKINDDNNNNNDKLDNNINITLLDILDTNHNDIENNNVIGYFLEIFINKCTFFNLNNIIEIIISENADKPTLNIFNISSFTDTNILKYNIILANNNIKEKFNISIEDIISALQKDEKLINKTDIKMQNISSLLSIKYEKNKLLNIIKNCIINFCKNNSISIQNKKESSDNKTNNDNNNNYIVINQENFEIKSTRSSIENNNKNINPNTKDNINNNNSKKLFLNNHNNNNKEIDDAEKKDKNNESMKDLNINTNNLLGNEDNDDDEVEIEDIDEDIYKQLKSSRQEYIKMNRIGDLDDNDEDFLRNDQEDYDFENEMDLNNNNENNLIMRNNRENNNDINFGIDNNININNNNNTENSFKKYEEFNKNYYTSNYCEVIKNFLYLGDYKIARDTNQLKELRITHIINSSGDLCENSLANTIKYLTLNLKDTSRENVECIFYYCFDFIQKCEEEKGKILIHCYKGVSRSVSIVIAYLIFKYKNTVDDTFNYVQSIRKISNPNLGFYLQLELFYKRITDKSLKNKLAIFAVCSFQPEQANLIVAKLIFSSLNCINATVDEEEKVSKEIIFDERGMFIICDVNKTFILLGNNLIENNKQMYLNFANEYILTIRKYENIAKNNPVIIQQKDDNEEIKQLFKEFQVDAIYGKNENLDSYYIDINSMSIDDEDININKDNENNIYNKDKEINNNNIEMNCDKKDNININFNLNEIKEINNLENKDTNNNNNLLNDINNYDKNEIFNDDNNINNEQSNKLQKVFLFYPNISPFKILNLDDLSSEDFMIACAFNGESKYIYIWKGENFTKTQKEIDEYINTIKNKFLDLLEIDKNLDNYNSLVNQEFIEIHEIPFEETEDFMMLL